MGDHLAEKVVFITGVFFLLFLIITRANSPVGIVEISTVPDGVRVNIDDVPRGVTSAEEIMEISLPPGRHTIVATKEGYTSYISAFQIERGETKGMKIELERLNY